MPRPFRPRPAKPSLHEPSVTPLVRAVVALMGARNALTPQLRRRLEMTGLTWAEVSPILTRVRTIDGWVNAFTTAAATYEAGGDDKRAAAAAFLGQLVLSPFHPSKEPLQAQMRRCHVRARAGIPGVRFEQFSLCEGRIAAYRETPLNTSPGLPAVLLLPPLASTKEELTLLGDPLLAAGFPIIRADVPGQGESPPPLPTNAETLLMRGMDELGVTAERGLIVGGISLGSYFALRLAGTDTARVRGAFGISPPAIITPAQWARQPEIIWQYLDRYFATETRDESLRLGLSMTLDDAVAHIRCPVRLYHASDDRISLPDARDRYRAALNHAPLTDAILPGPHGCLRHLQNPIAPEIVAWAAALSVNPKPGCLPTLPGT